MVEELKKINGIINELSYVKGMDEIDCEFIIPYKELKNKKVILWGAGKVGQFVNDMLRNDRESFIIGWVDSNYIQMGGAVESPEVIRKREYDLILICVAAENERSIAEICVQLHSMGVDNSKIIKGIHRCEDYLYGKYAGDEQSKGIYNWVVQIRKRMGKLLIEGEPHICNICGSEVGTYINGQRCPTCGSLSRGRMIWKILNDMAMFEKGKISFLHFAPERYFYDIFMKKGQESSIDYWPVDIQKSGMIRKQIDMTDIDFEDGCFDVIMAVHVLEHIVEDEKAMAELYRVLKPEGRVFLCVPIGGEKTYEDWNITSPEGRELHFGQFDHVRLYGMDIMERLRRVGFKVECIETGAYFSEKEIKDYGLQYGEKFIACMKV